MWSTCFSVFLSCCCSKLEHLCVRFLSWKHFLIGSFSIVLFLSHTPNFQIVVPTSFYLHCCALLHLQILLLKVKASLRRYFLEKKNQCQGALVMGSTPLQEEGLDQIDWDPFRSRAFTCSLNFVVHSGFSFLFFLFFFNTLKSKADLQWWLIFLHNTWFVFLAQIFKSWNKSGLNISLRKRRK